MPELPSIQAGVTALEPRIFDQTLRRFEEFEM
jgi:hypothetical protein